MKLIKNVTPKASHRTTKRNIGVGISGSDFHGVHKATPQSTTITTALTFTGTTIWVLRAIQVCGAIISSQSNSVRHKDRVIEMGVQVQVKEELKWWPSHPASNCSCCTRRLDELHGEATLTE